MQHLMIALCALVASGLIVSGCKQQSPSGLSSERSVIKFIDRYNPTLIKSSWVDIKLSEARFSFSSDGVTVVKRRAREDISKREYAEAHQFKNGAILYKKSPSNIVRADTSAQLYNAFSKANQLKDIGVAIEQGEIKTYSQAGKKFSYVIKNTQDKTCFIFYRNLEDSLRSNAYFDEYVNGSICEAQQVSEIALKNKYLPFVRDIEFDGGRQSTAQAFATALQDIDKIEGMDDSIIVRNQLALLVPQIVEIRAGIARIDYNVLGAQGGVKIYVDGKVHTVQKMGMPGSVAVNVAKEQNVVSLSVKDNSGQSVKKTVTLARGTEDEASIFSFAQAKSSGKKYAILIGIEDYFDHKVPDLLTPIEDITEISRFLVDYYGYEKTFVAKNPTRNEFRKLFNDVAASLTEEDELLIYYAGHGVVDDKSQKGYWLFADADADSALKWVSNVSIQQSIDSLLAKNVIIIADSCFSGSFIGSEISRDIKNIFHIRKNTFKNSRTVLTSGDLEPVLDGGGGGYSVFAAAFINLLRSNIGTLTGAQISEMLRHDVRRAGATQKVSYGNLFSSNSLHSGDFIFNNQYF